MNIRALSRTSGELDCSLYFLNSMSLVSYQTKLFSTLFSNFKIAKGAVVCSEAQLVGDITVGME